MAERTERTSDLMPISEAAKLDPLIGPEAFAEALAVNEATVYRWVKAGRLPSPDIQRKKFTRWRRSVVAKCIEDLIEAERRERVA